MMRVKISQLRLVPWSFLVLHKMPMTMMVKNLRKWLTANLSAKHVSFSQLSPAVLMPSYTASLNPLSACVSKIMTSLNSSKDSFSASSHLSTWSSALLHLSSFLSGLKAVLRLLLLYSSSAFWHSLSDQYSRIRIWLLCWLGLRPQPFSMPQLSFLICQRWWSLRACTTQNTILSTLIAFLVECLTVALALARHRDPFSAPSSIKWWASERCVTLQLVFASYSLFCTCSVLKASNLTPKLARTSEEGRRDVPWLKKRNWSRRLLACVTHPSSTVL